MSHRVRARPRDQPARRHGGVPEGNVEEAGLRVQFYEKLHERVGCPFIADKAAWPCREEDGSPCRHQQFWPCRRRKPAPRLLTTPTTQRLSLRMSFPFRDLEQASSLVLHLSLIDRMVVDSGQGTSAFAPATYVTRTSNLAMGLSAYGPALWWIMDTIDRAAADVLRAYIASTWRRPDLQEIQTGAWDR